jgi:hypothetical protein
MHTTARLKFSGRIAPDDRLHQVLPEGHAPRGEDTVIAPHYVYIPGVGNVPQYADTVAGPFVGYAPATDCDGYYMSFRFQPNNNCYAYGCNIASNSFAQPGRMHGYLYPDPPTGPGVQTGAEKDGLIYVGTDIAELRAHEATAPSAAGHYVALLISQPDTPNAWPGDYHWVRCDDLQAFASWSQKDGNDQVTNFDFAGEPITDPASANWTVNQGPISQQDSDDLVVSYEFYCYMYVPWGPVSII